MFFLTALTLLASSTLADDHKLWDAWYTVTLNGKIPYQVYHDEVEVKGGRLHYQNHLWKKEEGYINEEQLGLFAENQPELTPLFYNFHSTYRTTETVIDANVKNEPKSGMTLTVKARRGGQELPLVTKALPKKTIFSTFLPVWLGFRMADLSEGKRLSFMTLLEDNMDLEFSTLIGHIRVEKQDETAKKLGAKKLRIDLKDQKSFWWVDSKGTPLQIEWPAQNARAEKTTEQIAKKFLNGK